MARYYLNLVRILTTKSDQDITKNINRLCAHIKRLGVKYFYMVGEVSPQGLRHIHAILILDTLEKRIKVFNDIKASRLKAYIDDVSVIPNDNEANYYYRYVNKQFIDGVNYSAIQRLRGVNYNFCEEIERYNFNELNYFIKKTYRNDNDIFVED